MSIIPIAKDRCLTYDHNYPLGKSVGMHGNVWEWCQDWWKDGYYKESPVDDPTGAAVGAYRVLRGGGWSFPVKLCQSAIRNKFTRGSWGFFRGLRVSRVPADK